MEKQILNRSNQRPPTAKWVRGGGVGVIGIAIGAAGIYLGETDDAPGAALLGILMMIGMVALGVKLVRSKAR